MYILSVKGKKDFFFLVPHFFSSFVDILQKPPSLHSPPRVDNIMRVIFLQSMAKRERVCVGGRQGKGKEKRRKKKLRFLRLSPVRLTYPDLYVSDSVKRKAGGCDVHIITMYMVAVLCEDGKIC